MRANGGRQHARPVGSWRVRPSLAPPAALRPQRRILGGTPSSGGDSAWRCMSKPAFDSLLRGLANGYLGIYNEDVLTCVVADLLAKLGGLHQASQRFVPLLFGDSNVAVLTVSDRAAESSCG